MPQPLFLNAALRCTTSLEPESLLAALKHLEAFLGRKTGGQARPPPPACPTASHAAAQRFGPRPLDLDIIAYGRRSLHSELLEVPHPRAAERSFVLAPLADVVRDDGSANPTPAQALARGWAASGGESRVGAAASGLSRVLALPGGVVLPTGRSAPSTRLMLILNLTPDSFSDGGAAWSAGGARAVAEAALEACERAGPGCILDVGGQSTRPGAQRVSAVDEAARVMPVLRALRELCAGGGLPGGALLSVDTFYGSVAAEAAALGAHLLNDVSCGGRFDDALLPAVAASSCGYVLTHSRGEPATMALPEHTGGYGTSEGAAVAAVARELVEAAQLCSQAGVEAWRLVLDPGLGFGKARGTSRALLRGLGGMRGVLAAVAGSGGGALLHAPLLVGPSRKAFLLERRAGGAGGGVMGAGEAEERDWATAAALTACVAGGADIVRVHNGAAMRAVAEAADGIYRVRGPVSLI